jgi:ABC-type nitrate/sulfonate/bicarbonate transport system substrate-binding protein
MRKRAWLLMLLLVVVAMLSACGEKLTPTGKAQVVRVGVFKNVTHAAAYIALEKGYFAGNGATKLRLRLQPSITALTYLSLWQQGYRYRIRWSWTCDNLLFEK